jgi:hypothetical protein
MPRAAVVAVLLAVTSVSAAEEGLSPTPPPVVFEGFGLGDLSSPASVSRSLDAGTATHGTRPFDVIVRGPGAAGSESAPGPLATEVRGRIERWHVAAGFEGDARALVDRTPRWTGAIGLEGSGPAGGRSLEVRTLVESRDGRGRVGVEVGPRLERRLRRGARIFLDGAATAEAVHDVDAGGWRLPGTSTADGTATAGINARTGIIR